MVLGAWIQRPFRTEPFINGLQAIEWTIEERGLAGLSDREGIPWKMPIDQFFEAWVETVFRKVAQRTGGQIKVGRKRETTHPINWEPPYLGSQKIPCARRLAGIRLCNAYCGCEVQTPLGRATEPLVKSGRGVARATQKRFAPGPGIREFGSHIEGDCVSRLSMLTTELGLVA